MDNEESGFYTYELAYPKSMGGAVFYVGKGKGNRIDAHEREARMGTQSYKCNVIRKIWEAGEEVVKRKRDEHLSEEVAYERECLLIAQYGRINLTNLTDGGEGASIGNQNAAKGRTQLDVHFSLSGRRRQFFDRFTKTENGTPPTEEEIIKEARKMFYQMVDDAMMLIHLRENEE